jgi:hypothetical protein
MTKTEKIAELKIKYPILKKGVNEKIVELDTKEYEATIEKWADVELAQEAQQTEEKAMAAAKQALLDRLGITADEARLLLS